MAFAGVGPVAEVDAAVWTLLHADASEPRVARRGEVGHVLGHVAGGLSFELIDVQPLAVDVEREETVAVLGGELVAEIDHRPRVRVAAARFAVLARRVARAFPRSARPVDVVRAGFHSLERERVEVGTEHPLEACSGDDVEDVLNHAVGEERLAPLIERETPRIRRAVRDDLELVPHRMEPPDAAVHGRSLVVGRTGLADLRVRQDSVAAVQPTVRPPHETIRDVMHRLQIEPVEQHLRRTIGHVVAVGIGDEQQPRNGRHKNAAEPVLNRAVVHALVEKHRLLVERAIVVGVLQNEDAILPLLRIGGQPLRIRPAFDYPQPPAIIKRDRHRLSDVRLTRKQSRFETGRQLERGSGVLRRQRSVGGKRRRNSSQAECEQQNRAVDHGLILRGFVVIR